jgi:hypothetical protein
LDLEEIKMSDIELPEVTFNFGGGNFEVWIGNRNILAQPFDPRDGNPWVDEADAMSWWDEIKHTIHPQAQGLDLLPDPVRPDEGPQPAPPYNPEGVQ